MAIARCENSHSMIIETFPSGPLKTNAYALLDVDKRQIVVVDVPPGSASQLAHFATNARAQITAIWLTHSHWDHIADISALKDMLMNAGELRDDFCVAIHSADIGNLQNPGSDKIQTNCKIPEVEPTRLLQEGDELLLGHLTFEVLHTPGHSPGGICLYCRQKGTLFSGDTLFRSSIGNLSLPTAQPRQMPRSLQKLMALPAQTRVLPGHGPETTIASELKVLQGRFGIGIPA